MSADYKRVIVIAILILLAASGIFLIYKYFQSAPVLPPIVQKPVEEPPTEPTPIIAGPFKPIKLSCVKDEGVRYQEGDFVNNPSAVLLDDGRFRVYYDVVSGVIKSAVSTGGVFFQSEGVQKQGFPGSEEAYIASPSVIKTVDGWRMYYQGSATKPTASTRHKIFTAFSKTGLNFSGQGMVIEDVGDFGARNPEAVVLPGGQIRLYYLTSQGIKTALSNDGVSFVKENGAIITNTAGVSIFEYLSNHYVALCAANPNPARPELQTLRILNAKNSVDFDPKSCLQGSVALQPGTPFDRWGVQAPSVLKIGDAFRIFYQGFNVEPQLGGGSVVLSVTCSVDEI